MTLNKRVMPSANRPQNKFSAALKEARKAKGLAQEEFSFLSSRTYISTLERGLKSPTLNKVDALSEVLEIHPLTLLAMSYLSDHQVQTTHSLLDLVHRELATLLKTDG